MQWQWPDLPAAWQWIDDDDNVDDDDDNVDDNNNVDDNIDNADDDDDVSRYHESSSEPCSDSDQSYLRPDWRLQAPPHERRELDGCSAGSSPNSSCRASPRSSLYLPDGSPGVDGNACWC